jgi:hypothetical protein
MGSLLADAEERLGRPVPAVPGRPPVTGVVKVPAVAVWS